MGRPTSLHYRPQAQPPTNPTCCHPHRRRCHPATATPHATCCWHDWWTLSRCTHCTRWPSRTRAHHWARTLSICISCWCRCCTRTRVTRRLVLFATASEFAVLLLLFVRPSTCIDTRCVVGSLSLCCNNRSDCCVSLPPLYVFLKFFRLVVFPLDGDLLCPHPVSLRC